jgi:hypothetical protein
MKEKFLSYKETGPLLRLVLDAQDADEAATEFGQLEELAAALISLADALGKPVVWPIGAAAERLVGAATIASKGALRTLRWSRPPVGESVLLVCINSTSPLPLLMTAEYARRIGTRTIHACGRDIHGLDGSGALSSFESFHALDGHRARSTALAN